MLGNPTMTGYPIIDQSSTVVDPAWPQERHSSYPGRSLGVSGLTLTTTLATAREAPGEVSRGHSTPLQGRKAQIVRSKEE